MQWPGEERWEIIEGVPHLLAPAPGREHQAIAGELFWQVYSFFHDKECHVFFAPFDVRLPEGEEEDEEITTVVQPDLVVEVISLSTAKKDLNEKFNLYERRGVQEYWVVFPRFQAIEVYHLGTTGKYEKANTYTVGEMLVSVLFPGLTVDVARVFGG
ncbi:Uma2 family endonuclease [Desulfurispora thermophila]|uniref:Uma2 family endonuclease n=1 Tax=Desulfurispora thermophila TaxID=265470 RepID=UPI000361A375|nr:Uma2 family endonuclease [Desulfurispora thermophila]